MTGLCFSISTSWTKKEGFIFDQIETWRILEFLTALLGLMKRPALLLTLTYLAVFTVCPVHQGPSGPGRALAPKAAAHR